ncbi:putative fungal specific transcription protein [Rosellinia necatrix]|uniref:Putative fungal specific transcription protein n=1 Tax=Rosellinia necatrix TaxID=77044 RepID=A0A1W2TCH2_ROSNE|nr:putative fungal specific transcription protein [Rosellinia necatrix]
MDSSDTKPEAAKAAQSGPQSVSDPTPLPALPAVADGASTTLEVNGAALRLDHLGPLVVNENGTMSRIANWEKMADIERENTLRILGKRNQMRLAKLRAAAKPESSSSENGERES